MRESLYFLGAGSAGASLAAAFFSAGYRIAGVMDPVLARAEQVARATGAAPTERLGGSAAGADVVFVAVPDSLIGQVAQAAMAAGAAAPQQIWFHLSGALEPGELLPLVGVVRGVGAFHPAAVFPPGAVSPIPPGICFGVDGDPAALSLATRLASALGGRAIRVTAARRPLYHAGMVMASNAVVALLAAVRDALVAAGLPAPEVEQLLTGLAGSAVGSGAALGLDHALSGPIRRGDVYMVGRHLDALSGAPACDALYRATGRAIVDLARRAGTDPEALDAVSALLDVDPGGHDR